MPSSHKQFVSDNRILNALTYEEYEHLVPNLEFVHLAQGVILYNEGDVVKQGYFITSGMISLLCSTQDGSTTEVGMVGNEGMVGLPAILRVNITPYQMIVQIAADALKIKADILRREFNRGSQLQDLLLRYTHTLLTQISHSAACNRFHTMEARLCRWLLVSRDRVNSDTLYLTQEFLSQMIGAPRTSVTMIARSLQASGLISYKRGKIQILDSEGLGTASCECYTVVKDKTDQVMVA
jgi:CRP-like cAMP-binding protein